MNSKTPQFDELLDQILSELAPCTKKCKSCTINFDITEDDILFLKMLRVPSPNQCPDCRQKHRLSFANYSNIYRRKCDVPLHNHMILSPIASVMPWIAYDHETYYSDLWDAKSYGKDVEDNTPFFSQMLNLLKMVPHRGVPRGADSPNSDFSFYGKNMKDCYYVFGGRRSEDIMYSSSIYDSKHLVDCYFLRRVDTGFQSVITNDSFKVKYTYFSSSCIDCDFMYDCKNCQNCFGCVNLRNKNYCWFNEQLTKEEYFKKRNEIDLGSIRVTKEQQNKFWDFVKANPIRATRISKSENCIGNDIQDSRNLYRVSQADNCENVRYGSFAIMNLKDSMDVNHSGGASDRLYNCQNTGTKSSNIKCSLAVKESIDCEYMMYSTNCQNCFGCVGLKNASYMIFNKQYDKEEYFKKIDEIKLEMLKNETYGEFLPMIFSPTAYNSSLAQIIYPITEAEAQSLGVYWQPDLDADIKNLDSVNAQNLPDNISETTPEICEYAILGEESKKPYRLTQREIDFYKQQKICLPTDTPYIRMINRFKILSNFKTFKESCVSCHKLIESAHQKSEGYRPYCEKCYQQEVV